MDVTPSVDTGPVADIARESSSEAWWTGPLVASSANTLARGQFYAEPYLYDNLPYAVFDGKGHAHAISRQNDLGSMTYLKYGLTDRVTVGLTALFGYDWVEHGASSKGVGIGDPSVQVQYRLTPYETDTWIPTVAVNLQESLPMGRYDRLERPTDGFGSGTYQTTLSIYLQSLFWMPNGRILRARLNLSYGVSDRVSLLGQSVYDTPLGFRGHARPGAYVSADLAFEYSVTRSWVLAIDLWQQQQRNTVVAGSCPGSDGATVTVSSVSGAIQDLTVAPALEYNWSDRLGLIFGAQVVVSGLSVTATATPVVALSYMF
jgi:hypothetical protein